MIIVELLRTSKKDLLLKYQAEGRSVDWPEVNQSLNDMLNEIIIELKTLSMREQISKEDFYSLVEIAEEYTYHLQV